MNVLIVDPMLAFQQVVAHVFNAVGVKSLGATTLAEARERLASFPVAYVCSSLHLADGDGLSLCRHLRTDGNHRFTPFLLLSSESPDRLREAAFTAGVTEIFEKDKIDALATFIGRLKRQYERASGRVLLVEDSPAQSRLYREALENVGLSVDSVEDGDSALKRVPGGRYDLVITDLVLGGELSGVALIHQIRRLPGDVGEVPILAMSAFDDPARRIELFYIGVNDYVEKPVMLEELVARARVLIQSAKALGEVKASHRQAQSEIAFRVIHDSVTGMFNRWHFESVLDAAINRSSGTQALILIELAALGLVNDACGHAAGDQFLRDSAKALTQAFPGAATAHLEGARLAVLATDQGGEQLGERVSQCLDTIQRNAFATGSVAIHRAAYAGILSPLTLASTAADAISMAGSACTAAGRGAFKNVMVFDPTNDAAVLMHRYKDSLPPLIEALQNNGFVLVLHPIVPTRPDAPHGCEVLIRMRGRDGSLISPALFLPAAELYGIAPRIDRLVTTRTFEWLAKMGKHASPFDFASINLSGLTMTDNSFADFVKAELARTGTPPEHILFEITETAAVGDMSAARRLIRDIRELGCRFALDDFGAGLSSFGQLQSLPVDVLKIDGQFVRHLINNPLNQAIVRSVHEIGQAAGMRTVAEFVEDEAQVSMLSAIGIDYLQGHAFGMPLELDSYLQG